MDEQHQHDATPPPQSGSMSGLDGRYLRAGITTFVVVSVVALASIRAADYWAQTHGSHAVPVTPSDALSSYLPAIVVYLAMIAGAVYFALRRRRPAPSDPVSPATNRS